MAWSCFRLLEDYFPYLGGKTNQSVTMYRALIILFLAPFFSRALSPQHDTDKVKEMTKACVPLFEAGNYKKIKQVHFIMSDLNSEGPLPAVSANNCKPRHHP